MYTGINQSWNSKRTASTNRSFNFPPQQIRPFVAQNSYPRQEFSAPQFEARGDHSYNYQNSPNPLNSFRRQRENRNSSMTHDVPGILNFPEVDSNRSLRKLVLDPRGKERASNKNLQMRYLHDKPNRPVNSTNDPLDSYSIED